ncbi:MAG: hypothetical protein VZQ83_02175 [Eubacterium sp.]|nr:hypothetical protein [Eubacterium sp.]
MNGMDFMNGISNIDDKFVVEAAERPARKKIRWQHYASLAACLALTILSGAMLVFGPTHHSSSVETQDGVGSMIGSAGALFWITLAVGVIGVIISVALIIIGTNKEDTNYE